MTVRSLGRRVACVGGPPPLARPRTQEEYIEREPESRACAGAVALAKERGRGRAWAIRAKTACPPQIREIARKTTAWAITLTASRLWANRRLLFDQNNVKGLVTLRAFSSRML
jgi:hypothetical protein